jgi:hypothetical protein
MKTQSPSPNAVKSIKDLFVALSLIAAACLLSVLPGYAQEKTQSSQDADSRAFVHKNDLVNQLPAGANRYAIIIGVDKYLNPGINQLTGASYDAHNLANALAKYAGFKRENMWEYTSDAKSPGELPTGVNILDKLDELKGQIPKNGMLLVSFAGHGIEQDGNAYLLPYDAAPGESALKKYAISIPELKTHISMTGAGQVILILDSCRDDPFPKGRTTVKEDNPVTQNLVNQAKFDRLNNDISATLTLYAASPGQRAWEDTKNKGGYFTTALVEALSSEQLADEKGNITLGKVLDYLASVVPERVGRSRIGRVQKPYTNIDNYDGTKLVIAQITPKPKPVLEVAKGGPVSLPAPPLPAVPTTGKLILSAEPNSKLRLTPEGGGAPREILIPADQRLVSVPDLLPGTYSAVVTREGYEPVTEQVKIVAGKDANLGVVLKLATFPVTFSTNLSKGSVEYRAEGEPSSRVAPIQPDHKASLPLLAAGRYTYEVKTDDADFATKKGEFTVPVSGAVVVELERTSTGDFHEDLMHLNPGNWTGSMLSKKGYSVSVQGSGVAFTTDDRFRHYAGFQLLAQNVQLVDGVAASLALRVQDQNNYYLVQVTGAKSEKPYTLRTFVVRNGEVTPLADVPFPKHEIVKSQFNVTLTLVGQRLSVKLQDAATLIDFNHVLEVLDPGNTFQKGAVGVASLKGEIFQLGMFDVCVKCIDQPKP